MAGIFPSAGTPAGNTLNGTSPLNLVVGCQALFYRSNCAPVFDPIQANAIISEIANAINYAGKTYDCGKVDNLAQALANITDVCRFPTLAQLGIGAPDLDDTLAGCFDGQTGRVSIAQLAALILAQATGPCGAPAAGGLRDQDFVLACIDGNLVKAPFSIFKSETTSGDDFTQGGMIHGSGSQSGVNRGSFNVPGDAVAFSMLNITQFPYSTGVGENSVRVGYNIFIGAPGSGGNQYGFDGSTLVKRSGNNWIAKGAAESAWKVVGPYSQKTFDYYAGQFSDFKVYRLNPVGA